MRMSSIGFALVFLMVGCTRELRGSGTRASQRRIVPAFSQVESQGSADATITIGGEPSVIIETDDNLLDNITTEVNGGRLVLSSDKSYSSKLGVRATILAPSLAAVALLGSGNIRAEGVAGESFSADLMGSGNIIAKGSADSVRIEIAGSGDVNVEDLIAQAVRVSIAGSGNARVHASESLDAKITGSGDIIYLGDPKVSTTVLGSGSISKR